ncbi:MAG: glycosyltransferase [Proteobacteria bacterium]|nr:glycosyltransferase [Pseudomonadota bacterium]MBU1059656.1 glycosyltransferase [Pseudomonadota bacterium]
MSDSPIYNILMYSHDTYGLGHIRRSMAIASHLSGKDVNILILTGSPIAGRFTFPEQVDFVRIPGMIKKTNDEYHSLSIRIDPNQALTIRKNIIAATAKAFKPDLFIVDKEPLGLKREVLPTLKWLRRFLPATRTILGLRDILDEAPVVRRDWLEKDVYRYLEELYDEIWVYGNQEIYDPVSEYQIPSQLEPKIRFTGYIPRKQWPANVRRKIRKGYRVLDEDTFVLVTTGGGGDGCELLEHYLAMHDFYPTSLPFKSVIITGPFMPKSSREQIKKRAKRYGIKSLPFHPRMEQVIAAADLVISMGGYNTICEILSQQTPALIIPRETPRKEQLIRAEKLTEQGLIDYIPWKEMSAQLLREKIFTILGNSTQFKKSMASFQLSGLDTMRNRVEHFKDQP